MTGSEIKELGDLIKNAGTNVSLTCEQSLKLGMVSSQQVKTPSGRYMYSVRRSHALKALESVAVNEVMKVFES